MIRVWISKDGNLKETKRLEQGCWVDVTAPDGEEFKRVAVRTGIPEDILKTPLDEDERPRVEKEDGLTTIIVHIPVENADGDVPVATIPLGIFINEKHIVTLALRDSPVLEDFRKGIVRNFCTANKAPMVIPVLIGM